jgi:hypothetical protein
MFGLMGVQVANQVALDNLSDPWMNPWGFLPFLLFNGNSEKNEREKEKEGGVETKKD